MSKRQTCITLSYSVVLRPPQSKRRIQVTRIKLQGYVANYHELATSNDAHLLAHTAMGGTSVHCCLGPYSDFQELVSKLSILLQQYVAAGRVQSHDSKTKVSTSLLTVSRGHSHTKALWFSVL